MLDILGMKKDVNEHDMMLHVYAFHLVFSLINHCMLLDV